jgi:flagellar basal-body rod protein FlgF
MDHVLSAVLGSVHADMARMDRVGMNIANLQTPGYKREVVAALPFAARVDAVTVAVHTDERQGTLKATGQSLDFALSGPGWFEVATPAGPAYTRQGNFRLDAAGRLVTQRGDPVMGTGGEIVLAYPTPSVDGMGRVFEAPGGARKTGAPVAQLRIVRFEPGSVQRIGEGLVLPQGAPVAVSGDAAQVRQGFLEGSNVNPMREMVSLLESVRHLETLQKVALAYDEMLGTSIRKLGDVS